MNLTQMDGTQRGSKEISSRRKLRREESPLPPVLQNRLLTLFKGIEKEFESLYLENMSLKEKMKEIERNGTEETRGTEETSDINLLKSFTKIHSKKTRHKLKEKTSKIVSSFKTSSVISSFVSKEYSGHRDGLWDLDVSPTGSSLLATASADKTARIWNIETEKCLLTYRGHSGSVNSISFHPSKEIFLTGSGDGTAHLWKFGLSEPILLNDSEDSKESNDDDEDENENDENENEEENDEALKRINKTPLGILKGHHGVVSSVNWFTETQVLTASWDRTASLYDSNTETCIQTLSGHDAELNHVTSHRNQRLVATTSVDSTFRLWDFRDSIHSVSVFQGHSQSVTCAEFRIGSDQIVSGSDDRSIKVWDLRNMRSSVNSIHTASPINKFSISSSGIVAIPHDNRHIVLYDLNNSGSKLLRFPRETSKSHHRMVTAARWTEHSDQWKSKTNLFTAGFDRIALGWTVKGLNKEE